ncbi:MAG TPA: hypothetical protein VJ749_17590 [Pyrinomonadaceae bacterium]|nr:hypothetical protein [Pyrinomonadaceae bacterium]
MKYPVVIALLLFATIAPAQQKRADANKFVLIINGAGGEAAYAKQFEQWTTELQAALSDHYGFGAEQTKVLPRATAEDVKRTFAQLKTQLDANNVLFVFLIGHGSFDGKESKFNLVGPDLSASDYNALLTSLPTHRVVIFNMSSASGEFAKSLSAKGRIVITATKSGQESNATRFPGFFIAALNAKDADTDQDGHVSVLEAFVYANRLTADFYARAGRLATEHALLEDNGDGVGHEKAEAGEGLLARATYLDSLSIDEAAASAATGRLLKERTRLEAEIEQLIARKQNMPEAQYEASLERLFIELAKINRSIKQAGS